MGAPAVAAGVALALALWGAQSLVATFAAAVYRRGLPQPEIPGVEPRVAVMLPVKGTGCLAELLLRLRAQAYGAYRIVAAVESEDDPAFEPLCAAAAEPGAPIEVVVAGLAENAGQKVWNLLAALERLTPADEVVAFLDADTLPTPLWLPRLIAVLVNSGRPVATGYRWMIPTDDRWSSAALAAANNGIAALPRGGLPMTIVWGGSVAIRRTTLEAIRLEDYWRGAISDDLQMAEALRNAGLLAHAPRQALLLSPVCCSWPGFVAFGLRQYRLVWLHSPARWAIALACLWARVIGLLCAAPALAAGAPVAWAAVAVLIALGEARARLRRDIEAALWPEARGPQRRWVERLTRPVRHVLNAVSAAGAPLSREIRWAGVRYRVRGPQSVTIARRGDG